MSFSADGCCVLTSDTISKTSRFRLKAAFRPTYSSTRRTCGRCDSSTPSDRSIATELPHRNHWLRLRLFLDRVARVELRGAQTLQRTSAYCRHLVIMTLQTCVAAAHRTHIFVRIRATKHHNGWFTAIERQFRVSMALGHHQHTQDPPPGPAVSRHGRSQVALKPLSALAWWAI